MNRLTRLSLIGLIGFATAGCAREAHVVGQTQCFAPHEYRVAQAHDLVQGATAQSAALTAPVTAR